MKNKYMKVEKAVLVTGAAGFIGSHIVKKLVQLGASVHAVVRGKSNLWRLNGFNQKIKLHKVDLREKKDVYNLISKVNPSIIYHLAAYGVQLEKKSPRLLFETNVNSSIILLEAIGRYCSNPRVVIAGSCFEYGDVKEKIIEETPLNPVNLYGVSKVAEVMASMIIAGKLDIPCIICRPFGVYGPFEDSYRIIPHIFLSIINGKPIKVTEGKQIRDFTYVEDVAEAFIKAGFIKNSSQKINICSGTPIELKTVIKRAVEITKSGISIQWGAIPYRSEEMWTLVGDNLHAKRILNWEPKTSLNEGLKKTWEWFENNHSHYS